MVHRGLPPTALNHSHKPLHSQTASLSGSNSRGKRGTETSDSPGATTTSGTSVSGASGTTTANTLASSADTGLGTVGSGYVFPSLTPAPGISGTTIGDVVAATNTKYDDVDASRTHDLHAASGPYDYNFVNPAASGGAGGMTAVPHISSTDLAASLIAAGPAAAAMSAAAMGLQADEPSSIPVVTPVAPPAAGESGGGGDDVTAASTVMDFTPPLMMSGTPAEEVRWRSMWSATCVQVDEAWWGFPLWLGTEDFLCDVM